MIGRYLTPEQAAPLLGRGFTGATVRRLCASGEIARLGLTAIRTGGTSERGGRWHIAAIDETRLHVQLPAKAES